MSQVFRLALSLCTALLLAGTAGAQTAPSLAVEPPGGVFDASVQVSLSSDAGATIYYTLDGSEPDPSQVSAGPAGTMLYSGQAIALEQTRLIKAKAKDAAANLSSTIARLFVVRRTVDNSLNAGERHVIARQKDGTVWVWGNGEWGQYYDGVFRYEGVIPQRVAGIPLAVAVGAGVNNSLMVDGTGHIWTWGADWSYTFRSGQLFLNETTAFSGAVVAEAGPYGYFAASADGALYEWSQSNLKTPTRVGGTAFGNIVALAAQNCAIGDSFNFALKSDGSLWAWGANGYGQLGLGSTAPTSTPTQVQLDADGQPFTDIVSVDVGAFHSMALKADGSIWAWGRNQYGELGVSGTVAQARPVRVETLDEQGQRTALTGGIAVAAGNRASMALVEDPVTKIRNVYAWGLGGVGAGPYSYAVKVAFPQGVRIEAIAAGSGFAAAIDSNGEIWTWGSNSSWQLGDVAFTGPTQDRRDIPMRLNPTFSLTPRVATPTFERNIVNSRAISVSCATPGVTIYYTLDGTEPTRDPQRAIPAAGTVLLPALPITLRVQAWANADDLLPSKIHTETFSLPAASRPWARKISSSRDHELKFIIGCETDGAIIHYTTDGSDPTRENPSLAAGAVLTLPRGEAMLKLAAEKGALNLSSVTTIPLTDNRIAAGAHSSFAIQFGGKLYSWGDNSYYQLGYEQTMGFPNGPQPIPKLVPGIEVVDIAAGYRHSVALLANGDVLTWGLNDDGQLGDHSADYRTSPTKVDWLSNAIAVAAMDFRSVVLVENTQTGTREFWEFGFIDEGYWGISQRKVTLPTTSKPVAMAVGGDFDYLGGFFVLALTEDGRLWRWWENEEEPQPHQVASETRFVSVIATYQNAMAIATDGTVWTWGWNGNGQLGRGYRSDSSDVFSPVHLSLESETLLSDVVSIAAGWGHSVAVLGDGTFWFWGSVPYAMEKSIVPQQVAAQGFDNLISVAAGDYHTIALARNGQIWGWGMNGSFQLGNGTDQHATIPTPSVYTNQPPTLTSIGGIPVNGTALSFNALEGQELTLQVLATDPESAPSMLRYRLMAPIPSGVWIDQEAGVLHWTPLENQGPGTYPVTIRVYDSQYSAFYDEEIVSITVSEVNDAPILEAIPAQLVQPGEQLTVRPRANDRDIPSQTLTYSLGEGTPAGVQIDAQSGAVTWTPPVGTIEQPVTVIVTDSGTPTLSASQTFTVTVNQPPVVGNFALAGVVLTDGATVSQPGQLSVNATDSQGVSFVEFYVGSQLIGTDSSAVDGFNVYWDISQFDNEPVAVKCVAYDSFGLSSELTRTVNLILGTPTVPVITSPANNVTSNTPQITIKGSGTPNSRIKVYLDNVLQTVSTHVGGDGKFLLPITLKTGVNAVQVSAVFDRNENDESGRSGINVIVDSTTPALPRNLRARATSGGAIELTWSKPESGSVAHYEVYRWTESFTEATPERRIAASVINLSYHDTQAPAEGQTYYYRVRAIKPGLPVVNSDFSNEAAAAKDSTPPVAVAIRYTPQPDTLHDPLSGRFGRGAVAVQVEMSEALVVQPFLSLAVSGGTPIGVELLPERERFYRGTFVITEGTKSGVANALLSALDLAGNRGTAIEEGGTLTIDTSGPQVESFQPALSVIRNSSATPAQVTLLARLSEPVKNDANQVPVAPIFKYSLSKTQPALSAATVTDGGDEDPLTWQLSFTLPAQAGEATDEILALTFEATDDFGTKGTTILPNHLFQVYQGNLPALAPPGNLQAVAQPGGKVLLTWKNVESASGYRVYRHTESVGPFTEIAQLTATETSFEDTAPADGAYWYAVASVRTVETEEAISEKTSAVSVIADSAAPVAPVLDAPLILDGRGVRATWTHAGAAEAVTFKLYRYAQATPGELHLVADNLTAVSAVDSAPDGAEPYYVVTAVDTVGNESPVSNAVYNDKDLFPARKFAVTQRNEEKPLLTWTAPAGLVSGYNLFVGEEEANLTQLNTALLTADAVETGILDDAYSGQERLYWIETVRMIGEVTYRSPKRSLRLPVLNLTARPENRLVHGVMNEVVYDVHNASPVALSNIRVKAGLTIGNEERLHSSDAQSIPPGATVEFKVVVPGYSELPAEQAELYSFVEIMPNPDEKVEILRTAPIGVVEGGLVADVFAQDLIRGGNGKVRLNVSNPGALPIDFIFAEGQTSQASSQIRFLLLDGDGNVLARVPFKQTSQSGDCTTCGIIVTPSHGRTLLRLGPGEEFTSEPIAIPVPDNAPDQVFVRLEIDTVYYQFGVDGKQEEMDGPDVQRGFAAVNTGYIARVTSVTPPESNGNTPVAIQGVAEVRGTTTPAPYVPVVISVEKDGFIRDYEVSTDASGTFSLAFQPEPRERGGIYSVWAQHPELNAREVQATFTIRRVQTERARYAMRLPWNFKHSFPVNVITGAGTTVNNVRLEFLGFTNDGTSLPEEGCMSVSVGDPIGTLVPGAKMPIAITLTGHNGDGCADVGTLYFRVASDENQNWYEFEVNFEFEDAAPVARVTPVAIDTAVQKPEPNAVAGAGTRTTEIVTLENVGLLPLEDVQVSLTNMNGTVAPAWVTLGVAADLGDLAVGAKLEIPINLVANDKVPTGNYEFKLTIESANGSPSTGGIPPVGIYVTVTEDGEGSVRFTVRDLFQGYVPPTVPENPTEEQILAANPSYRGVPNATITLEHELLANTVFSHATDANGEYLFDNNLPAGPYKVRVNASKHNGYIGRVVVKPGQVQAETVDLDYSLVSFEWEVVPTTIQDRYDLLLEATYETDVPAPRIVVEPPTFAMPDMCPGQVYNGQFKVTNSGFVKATHFEFGMPPSDEYFQYELLDNLPEELEPNQVITVAYRIKCLKALPGSCGKPVERLASAAAGIQGAMLAVLPGGEKIFDEELGYLNLTPIGAGGCSYGTVAWVYHEWVCPWNPALKYGWSTPVYAYKGWTGCEGGGGGGWWGPQGTAGRGKGSGGGGSGKPIIYPKPKPGPSGPDCFPPPPPPPCFPPPPGGPNSEKKCEDNQDNGPSCNSDQNEPGHSWVNLASREYQDYAEDLWLTVPGGHISVGRAFYGGKWHWTHAMRLRATRGIGAAQGTLHWGGSTYKALDSAGKIYGNGSYRIYVEGNDTEGSYRWQNQEGTWMRYDLDGRLIAVGYREGTIAKYEYGQINPVPVTPFYLRLWPTAPRLDDKKREIPEEFDGPTKITNPDGSKTYVEFIYNEWGLWKLRDWANREVTYTKAWIPEEAGLPIYEAPDGSDPNTPALPPPPPPILVLKQVTNIAGETTIYTYGAHGRSIVHKKDAKGDHFIGYDSNGGVSSLGGRQFFYQWDESKREYYARVDRPGGGTVEKRFDRSGNLIEEKIDGVLRRKLVRDGRRVTEIDAEGHPAVREYDERENLIREVLPNGRVRLASYEPLYNRPLRTVNAAGLETKWVYNGNEVTKIQADGTVLRRQEKTVFDEFHRTIERVDARGNSMKFEYNNPYGLLSREYDPADLLCQTLYTYDTRGFLDTKTDALGRVTEYDHDDAGRRTKEANPLLQETIWTYNPAGWLLQQEVGRSTEGPGRITRYRYDLQGRRTHSLRVDANGVDRITSHTVHDGNGRVLKEINALGQVAEYEYDERGNQTKVKRPYTADATSDITMEYDDENRLVSQFDPIGVETRTEYDTMGRVKKRTEAVGLPEERSVEYTYDNEGRVQTITYQGKGLEGESQIYVTRYSYDLLGRRTSVSGDRVLPQQWEYDANDNMTARIDGRGIRTEMSYDSKNRLTSTTAAVGRPEASTGSLGYDRVGNILWQQDGVGNFRYTHYDALNRSTEESVPVAVNQPLADGWWSNPATVLRKTVYNSWGQATTVYGHPDTDGVAGGPFVLLASMSYDSLGRLTSQTDAAGLTLTFEYNALDQQIAVHYPPVSTAVTARATAIRAKYDPHNGALVRAFEDRAGNVTQFGYNIRFERSSETNSMGGTTAFEYDALGRINAVTDPFLNVTQTFYNQFDQPVQVIHPDHVAGTRERIETLVYDRFGQLVEQRGAGTYPLAFGYDLSGNRASMTDGNQSTTQWEYDGQNHVTRKIYADNNDYEYTYDGAGRLRSRRDSLDRETLYDYNAYGLLTLIDYPTDPDVSFGYDALGRRTSMTDGDGVVTQWTHDSAGRVVGDIQGHTGHSLAFTYDVESHRTAMEVAGVPAADENWQMRYSYDEAGRLESVLDPRVSTSPFTYRWKADASLIEEIATPGGLKTTKMYDQGARLTSTSTVSTRGAEPMTLQSYGYTYDKASQREREISAVATRKFGYDEKRQLISAVRVSSPEDTPDPRYSYGFIYDAIGNRMSTEENGVMTTYTSNVLNQYTAVSREADGTVALGYDANGNQISGENGRVYEWDEENRLKAVVDGDRRCEYAYDGLGRRVIKRLRVGGQLQSETRFDYDGWNLLAEWNTTGEALGQSNGSQVLLYTYCWGLDLSGTLQDAGGVGGLVAMKDELSEMKCSYHYDGNGNVVDLYDLSNGESVAHFEYTPFGDLHRSVGPMAERNAFRWGTKYQDRETGLSYYGYRYYEPKVAKWLNRDPFYELGGANLSAITSNDSINVIDVDGRYPSGYGYFFRYSNGQWNAVLPPWQQSYSGPIDPTATIGPVEMGVNYLFGTGPARLEFHSGDYMVEELKRSDVVQKRREEMVRELKKYCDNGGVGAPPIIGLGGELGGIPWYEYMFLVFPKTMVMNRSEAYVGSFSGGTIAAISIDCKKCTATIQFNAYNRTGAASGTRFPPFMGGYGGGLSVQANLGGISHPLDIFNFIGAFHSTSTVLSDDPFGVNAPLRTVTQTYEWTETVALE